MHYYHIPVIHKCWATCLQIILQLQVLTHKVTNMYSLVDVYPRLQYRVQAVYFLAIYAAHRGRPGVLITTQGLHGLYILTILLCPRYYASMTDMFIWLSVVCTSRIPYVITQDIPQRYIHSDSKCPSIPRFNTTQV